MQMLIIIGGGHIGAHASASQPQPQSHTRGAPMTITAGQESLFQDMSKYVGHSSGSFTPVITLSNNCLLTYQHGDHDSWAIGDIQDCMVNHQDATMRVSVQAVVRWVCTYQDYFLLETPAGSLDFPTVDTACCSGRPYFLVGNSARSRIDPVSYRYGFILSTKLDQRGCILGDITRTVAGYSGYGCFSLRLKLIVCYEYCHSARGIYFTPYYYSLHSSLQPGPFTTTLSTGIVGGCGVEVRSDSRKKGAHRAESINFLICDGKRRSCRAWLSGEDDNCIYISSSWFQALSQ